MILPFLTIAALGGIATVMVWASRSGLTTRTPPDGEPP